jgi:hypothetical protein
MADIDTEAKVSYKAREMNYDLDKEIDRLRVQALWGWDKESRNLGWFGLRDGMSIVESSLSPLTNCPFSKAWPYARPELILRGRSRPVFVMDRGMRT